MFSQIWQRRDQSSFGYPGTNHMDLRLVTPPAQEPVSMTDFKGHARIPYPNADATLANYIQAARETIELYLRRSLITQTWDYVLDWGPAWLELPKGPIQSVVGVFTTDLANVETQVPTTTYFLDTNTGLVSLNIGNVWPLHRGKAGFRVRYTAGYGNNPSDVPATIRRYITSLATVMDNNRDQVDMSDSMKTGLAVYRILGETRMARAQGREDMLS